MSKRSKNRDQKTLTQDKGKAEKEQLKKHSNDKTQAIRASLNSDDYLIRMSYAPSLQEDSHWFQMLPVLFFTAVIIMITRMASYERPMAQFFWYSGNTELNDFFSYYKMTAIVACAIIALVFLLYRVITQAFYIKKSFVYIPMIVYSVFVILSYLFSDYKLFALWGWNDRFEGTVTLLCYMVMLFFVINTVNAERNVKLVVYFLAITSSILGLLGLTQAFGHDFLRTVIGKKLITPTGFWDQIDNLNFTFQNNEIYQTVYNINYVSFYLTLLIPLFGLLFIHSVMKAKEEPLLKKIAWGALFALLVYNLIGSASSGGLMGMAALVFIAVIILNKKILIWWKPIMILLVITAIVGGVSYQRWLPELSGAFNSVTGKQAKQADETTWHKIDYIETTGNAITLSYEGNHLTFMTYPDDPSSLSISGPDGSPMTLLPVEKNPPIFQLEDERYSWITVKPAQDEKGNHFLVLTTDGTDWPFMLTEKGPKYRNAIGNLVDLHKVPAIGWKNNQAFGSGRGYIWSRTIPMLKNTLFLGHGADTYCIYFPHKDYVGKYNAAWNLNVIVDKPHDMFMGIFINTGGLSLLALLILWGIYIVQSFILYCRERFESFQVYTGAGIFLGICGFLVSGLVNDSSVSVTPMFYGLLGTGIAINMMLKKSSNV